MKYWCINLIRYEQDLYEENYKTLKNKVKELAKWKEFHVHSRKNQNCQDVSSFQLDLYSQCHPHQNPRKLSCGYQETDSKVYTKRQVKSV